MADDGRQAATAVPFKVAAVEFNAGNESLEANIEGALEMVREAASEGAKLIVLPEIAFTGVASDGTPLLDTVPGRATEAFASTAGEFDCYVAFGVAEIDSDTTLIYNSAALVGPGGFIGKYRKNGLAPSDKSLFSPGNTGYPVFDTALGRICLGICYDDTYWESARLPTLKGADIMAHSVASLQVLAGPGESASTNHITIAAVQEMCAWNGLSLISTDRNNSIQGSGGAPSVYFPGASSIWQATGERIAQSAAVGPEVSPDNPGQIIYGTIDPALFENEQKDTLAWRRPKLYRDLTLFKAPDDMNASKESHRVRAAAVQAEQAAGDRDANQKAIEDLTGSLEDNVDLVVLPAFTFTGPPTGADGADALAEPGDGPTQEATAALARHLGAHVVASHVETDGGNLFHRAILVDPDGKPVGSYRQCHLDPERSGWATGGDDLPVFDTTIGRIGLLLCEDARIPEAAGMMAVRRADIIAMPTNWDGSYGGPLQEPRELFRDKYPENTMCLWYATAKMSQAYTVVANSVGAGAKGDSGIFTINPVDSDEVPVTAPSDIPGVAELSFNTLGDPSWWLGQQALIAGRRPDLAVPLALPTDSRAFTEWKKRPGYAIDAWAAYEQQAKG
ncbi:MAG: nitrilase-related carbon-nitrogen hydrolase [Solirubrobacterales bacterium]